MREAPAATDAAARATSPVQQGSTTAATADPQTTQPAKTESSDSLNKRVLKQAAVAYFYVALWNTASAIVILFNKWLLSFRGFPYPLSLTMMHMAFGSVVSFVLCRVLKVVKTLDMPNDEYIKRVLPIGVLFSLTLWLGNAAYLYLSVAFIQMLKALMPVAVFFWSLVVKGTEFQMNVFLNMMVVSVGVAIASYGELRFVLIGFGCQIASVGVESLRLVLIEILLKSKGINMNPVTTLYYIAPVCFACLAVPFFTFELSKITADPDVKIEPGLLLLNCCCAFALNRTVFLLIGRTSAIAMNVAGVVKDWILIALSSLLFTAPISGLNLFGYGIAFLGVCYYNYRKLQLAKQAMAEQERERELANVEEGKSLLSESPDQQRG